MTTWPPIDTYLASVGEPLEDIDAASPQRHREPTGVRLTETDLTDLGSGRRRRHGSAALRAAGLVDDRGDRTELGISARALLTAPTGVVEVRCHHRGLDLSFVARLRAGEAAILATLPPPGDRGPVDEGRWLDLVDAAQVPSALASWVGLRPAWSLATSPARLPEAVVAARLEDEHAPVPEDADGHLRHVWQQEWTLWTLTASGLSEARWMLNTGRTGHYSLTASDVPGSLEMRPVAATNVWADLLYVVATAASHRGGEAW